VPPRQAAALTFRRFGRRILGRKASNRVKASKSRLPIEISEKNATNCECGCLFQQGMLLFL